MNVYFIPQTLLSAAFLRAVLLGFAAGGVYDVLRAPRRAFRVGKLPTAVLDGVFVLALIGSGFWFFVVWAYGIPRGFIVLGIALGTLLYFRTLSPLVLLLLVAVLTVLTKIFVRCAGCARKILSAAGRIRRVSVRREKIQKKSKFLFHFRTK